MTTETNKRVVVSPKDSINVTPARSCLVKLREACQYSRCIAQETKSTPLRTQVPSVSRALPHIHTALDIGNTTSDVHEGKVLLKARR
jgi:hypothetical protein